MAQYAISTASDLQALFAGTYNPGGGVVTLQNGDVIKLAAGTYASNLTINKGVIIEGPNDGVGGSATRAAEAVITGQWTISSAAGVTIDGVKFLNDRTIAGGAGTSLLVVNPTGVTHLVENSVFDRDPPDNPPDPSAFLSVITNFAIRTQGAGGAGGGLTIQNNLFTGQNDVRTYANDVWANAIWSEGSVSSTLIRGNEFENTRAGINAANFNANTQITGNTFHDMGTAITFGSATTGAVTTVTGNTFASDIDTELNLKNLTGDVDVRQIITGNTFSPAAQPMWIETGGGADTLLATSGADTFLTYKEGSPDTAVDTVIYSDRITSLTKIDGGWQATSSGNSNIDVLKGVDIIDDSAAGRILLVGAGGTAGSGGYATIQAAINAAAAGDTIYVAPGTYAGAVTINKAGLTIVGAGSGVIIDGSNSGAGVTIAAADVTLKNLRIQEFATGVELANGVGATLDGVTIADGVTGVRKGSAVNLTDLEIKNSTFDGLRFGVYLTGNPASDVSSADGVRITNSTFTDISFKGIYAEALSNAVLDRLTMSNVGQFGEPAGDGNTGRNGNGVDINLKFAAFTNITISNFTFTDVGLSNGGGSPHSNGAAIAVKVRDDAPNTVGGGTDYSANPASFTGAIVIINGVINGTSTGIRAGEDGKNAGKETSGPEVDVTNVKVTGFVNSADHGAFINDTTKVMDVTFTAADYIFQEGPDSGVINHFPFVVAPDPVDEDPPAPPPPPPPNPGQGPGPQTPNEVLDAGFNGITGIDPTSDKATSPTITLPNGQQVANPIYEEVQQLTVLAAQLQAGLISEATVIDKMVEFAADTTAVALQSYQFFTGATPTKEGVAYLVNSEDNANDLTDPYYATFSADNRYINFAVSLGTGGTAATAFREQYAALTFEESVRVAYGKIIGLDKAAAAGIDVNGAVAYVMTQLAYFTALGGSDIGAKAAMIGFLMYAGMSAKIGVYYEGTRGFLSDVFHGAAEYNVDLTGGAAGVISHAEAGLV